jgi:DNA-binding beta-propeller fold protein YncE
LKRIAVLPFILLIIILFTYPVSASAPYKGYTYNQWGEALESPNGYTPVKFVNGADMGAGRLDGPQDLYYNRKNRLLYVADTGNDRILVLDEHLNLVHEINRLTDENGETDRLRSPNGVFADDNGLVYVADTRNGRVVVCTHEGVIVNIIGAPSTPSLPPDFAYMPMKLVVDDTGLLFIQARDVYQGFISMDGDGNFLQFYGSNRVDVTAEVLFQQFLRKFMTREQRKRMISFIPTEYSNLYLDDTGFIYAVVSKSQNSLNQIKRLNANGDNILRVNPHSNSAVYRRNNYGDFPVYYTDEGRIIETSFIDVHYDNDRGLISALDATRGRIFVYDTESNLMFVFGALGSQLGSFTRPVAIEKIGDNMLVLDSETRGITVFKPTEYGYNIMEAVSLYGEGKYIESFEPWRRVLRQNTNYLLAYDGIGKAYFMMGEYKQAMRYFKFAYNKSGYSLAQEEYQIRIMRDNMHFVAAVVLILGVIPFVLPTLLAKRKPRPAITEGSVRRLARVHFKLPLYTIFHPIDGLETIKYTKINSNIVSFIILALFITSDTMLRKSAGFIYTWHDPELISLFDVILERMVVFLLITVANFLLCTFMEGEGTYKEIFAAASYCTLIFTFMNIGALILTQFMSIEMMSFFVLYNMIFYVWCGIYVVCAVMAVHQFGFYKALANIFFTIIFLALIAGLIFLLYSLYMQVASFFYTVFNELQFRF